MLFVRNGLFWMSEIFLETFLGEEVLPSFMSP
jgi:hypothetical protein